LNRVEASTEAQALAELQGFYERLLAALREGGICSLAGTSDNELMWANYSDEHRGICLEYEDDLFSKYPEMIKRSVTYSGTGIVDVFHHGYVRTYELLHSIKSLPWKYENETRFYLFGTPHGCDVSHRSFTAVILGYRTMSMVGLNDDRRRAQQKEVLRLANTITKLNKVRERGMKLRIKKVVRTYFRFDVIECDTGKELQAMFQFAAERSPDADRSSN
jgi:hypothetical protein